MAKIQFRIREKGTKRAIADATMLMNCTLSDGSKWNSGVQKMTSPGVVWLEIPDKTFKEIDPKTVSYEIVKNGQKLKNSGSMPKGNGTSTFRIDIAVEKATRKPVETNYTLIGKLIDENDTVVSGATVEFLESGNAFDKSMSDKDGAAKLTLNADQFKSIDWPNFSTRITLKKQELKVLKISKAKPEANNTAVFDVRVQRITATEPAPNPSPENPSDTGEKTLNVIGTLINQSGDLIGLAEVDFISAGVVFSSSKSNKSGEAKLTLTEGEFKQVDWTQFSVNVLHKGQTLTYLKNTPPKKDPNNENTLLTTVTLKVGSSTEVVRDQSVSEYLVSGTVLSDDNSPLMGITVKAFDKEAGAEKLLGTAESNTLGQYQIEYSEKALIDGLPNLIVRAYPSKSSKKAIAESPMRENASKHAHADLIVDRKDYRGDALFDLVHQKIIELNLQDKFEGLTINDSILVAKQAGLDLGVIEQYINAAKMTIGSMVMLKKPLPFAAVAEPFFGVIRAGLAPTPAAFSSVRDSHLQVLLEQALKENWIDDIDPKAAVDAIRPLRVQLLLDVGQYWAAILQSNGATQAQMQMLAERYLQSDLPLDKVIEQLIKAGELPAKIGEGMQDALALFDFAASNTDFLQGLTKDYKIKRPLDLIKLSLKDWNAIAKKYFKEMPDWVEGKTKAEQLSFLAHKLQCTVEAMFATAYFTVRWQEDGKLDKGVPTWLAKNPKFEFNNETLLQYEKRTGKGLSQNKAALLRTERLFQISPDCGRFSGFKGLWLADYESARQVLDKGLGGFIKDMAHQGLAETVANDIYKRAQRVSSRDLLSMQPVPVGLPDKPSNGTTNSVIATEPTIAALFGDKGGNGCDHCISAFSPSAYLVDMLRFLERSSTHPDPSKGKTGLELLFSRRPDIKNLRLDCGNSDTPMPYIDLVNELLEHIVATSKWPLFQVPKDWIVDESLDLNTQWTMQELAAHPEHLNIQAYNRLRNFALVAPWNLPYNLWADEVRTYLTQIGIDRTDMMLVIRPNDDPVKIGELSMERLGVNAAEVPVLAMPADDNVKIALVWQTSNPAVDLKNIRDFLRRTELTYEEAETIFATRFVNPLVSGKFRQIMPKDLSDLSVAELKFKAQDNQSLLDRFHRFTRLWRKTGWSAVELDAVLQNVLNGDLDAIGLADLGMVAELHQRYGTPIEELATWFGKIPDNGNQYTPGLYSRTFLDGSVNGVVADGSVSLLDDVFNIVGTGKNRDLGVTKSTSANKWLAEASQEVDGEWVLETSYAPIVLAGCRVTASDVLLLIKNGILPKNSKKVALNLANLSQIYRQASIARALQISIQELVEWQVLSGQKFGPQKDIASGPGIALLLAHEIDFQLQGGVSAANLSYGLKNLGNEIYGPSSEDLDALVETIRTDLLKMSNEFKTDTLSPEASIDFWMAVNPTWEAPELTNIDDEQERIAKTANSIPFDVNALNQASTLLSEAGLSEQDVLALLGLLCDESVNDPTSLELFSELLPSMTHNYLKKIGDVRIAEAVGDYYQYLVLAPMVVGHLSSATSLNDEQVSALSVAVPEGESSLVSRFLQQGFLTGQPNEMTKVILGLERLYRQASLINSASLDVNAISFSLLQSSEPTNVFDFSTAGSGNLLHWRNTFIAHQLNGYLESGYDLYDFLTAITSGEFDETDALEQMAGMFAIEKTDVITLISQDALNVSFPTGFANINNLHRLHQASLYLKQVGTDATQLLQLVQPILNVEHANTAKSAVRAHYDERNWQEVSSKLREGIRERQRDALLNFVRTRGGFDMTHEQAYAFYLIDVDMGACYETSRTKQAIASVQQFVQRILLGLEYEAMPGNSAQLNFFKEDAQEWKWRKNYRVWEANVKVFVYPENWLEPELRDNKTPFFEEFEQELMQGELTESLAEDAVTNYLEKLHDTSNLEIINIYDDEALATLTVIARTRNLPNHYYMRERKNDELWTPWQKIDTEIDSEHVIPVVYSNRLYVFWPTFTEELNEPEFDNHPIKSEIEVLQSEIDELGATGQEPGEQQSGKLGDLFDVIAIYEEALEDIEDLGGVPNIEIIRANYESLKKSIDLQIVDLEKRKKDLNMRLNEKEREHELIKEQFTYLNIEMNWTVKKGEGWAAKKLSTGLLRGPDSVVAHEYRFSIESANSARGLTVNVYTSAISDHSVSKYPQRMDDTKFGYFKLSDCSGELLANYSTASSTGDSWRLFTNGAVVNTQHVINPESTTGLLSVKFQHNDVDFLHEGGVKGLVAVEDCKESVSTNSFFISDDQRTFFVHEENAVNTKPKLDMSSKQLVVKSLIAEPNMSAAVMNKRSTHALSSRPSTTVTSGSPVTVTGTRQNGLQSNVKLSLNQAYRIESHYHPFTCLFLKSVNRFGLDGLYFPNPNQAGGDQTLYEDMANLSRQKLEYHRFQFEHQYRPNTEVVSQYPEEKIDFRFNSAYGQYNWELFFHIPMLVAVRLMQNQKFEQAQGWFHAIFDPTERSGSGPERYWKIKPFFYAQLWGDADDDLDEELDRISDDDALSLESLIETWESNPFQPHAIARFRITSYMRMTVMKYLDNLIAWGDQLFKQDSMESINEATQLYVLAATILGERPIVIDNSAPVNAFTVDEFLQGWALRARPTEAKPTAPAAEVKIDGEQGILGVLDQFCLPYNDRLLEYWDTVGDRLFKIRHCLNIDGVFRKLPLYQPPIDPAMLVRASASGADLSSVLNNLSAPLPNYRFSYVQQKATELISQTQGMAGQLLSALEKQDAEAIANIRATHEVALLEMASDVRKLGVQEAKESLDGLIQGRKIVESRYIFYRDRKRASEMEIVADVGHAAASALDIIATFTRAAAGPAVMIPDIYVGGAGAMGSPVAITMPTGGEKVSKGIITASDVLSGTAMGVRAIASAVGSAAGRQRRTEEWDFQADSAKLELTQYDKQIAGAEIRVELAEKELDNHKKQIEYAQEAKAFLSDKFTNQQLYSWVSSQLSALYFQTYQLAFDMAKRAERCYQHELGVFDTNFIQFGYWDSLKKGLLAGERLQLDLKRMESSYIENNDRELELSKTVSLLGLNPESLIRLRETGECFVTIPEGVFDLDYPGHYFRRIKSVSLTIPAITGPYTTMSCTLTLLSDKYRLEAKTGDDESGFEWNVGAIQSIATSSAQGDSGLFQLDFRDERYLPFERAGVVSSWKLNLPKPDIAQFDYSTISDVLIQINYTARDGGDAYRTTIQENLINSLNSVYGTGLGIPQILSVKQHFPDQWALLEQDSGGTETADEGSDKECVLSISLQHLPYFIRRRVAGINSQKVMLLKKAIEVDDFAGDIGINSSQSLITKDPNSKLASVSFQESLNIDMPFTVLLSGDVANRVTDIDDIIIIATVTLN